jgi:hypothetical protein
MRSATIRNCDFLVMLNCVRIAMTSEEAVGPLDIAKLLALLNASEDDASQDGATPGNRGQTVLPLSELEQSAEKIDLQEEIDLHPEVLPATAAQAQPVAPDDPVPQDVENRFAAHIVHGMAKLKAR